MCVCMWIAEGNYEPGTKRRKAGVGGLMKGPLVPTCSLSAVVSLLKRQLFLRRSVCVCVLVSVRELVEVGGEAWLRVALFGPLHIKRLVASGDLSVQNTTPRARVKHHYYSVVLWPLPAHVVRVKLRY